MNVNESHHPRSGHVCGRLRWSQKPPGVTSHGSVTGPIRAAPDERTRRTVESSELTQPKPGQTNVSGETGKARADHASREALVAVDL